MKIKKTLALVIATSMVFSLAACSSKKAETEKPVKENSVDSIEVTTESTEKVESTEQTEVETAETEVESTEVETTETEVSENTVAKTLYELFEAEVATTDNINDIANNLIKSECFGEVAMVVEDMQPGYLSGFENEITAFNKCTMFAPMIGTIPFVGYIFEADDTELLVTKLSENAALNWNICTTADEMLVETYDNYVFFVMSPYSFGE